MFSDKILEYMHQRFNGRFAPVSFYVNSYINTMKVLTEGVSTHRKTLASMVDDTSCWSSFWTNYNPAAASPAQSEGPGRRTPTHGQPDLDKHLKSEIDRQEMLRRQLQSKRDKEFHVLKSKQQANPADQRGGGARSSGGKRGSDTRDAGAWQSKRSRRDWS